jgi:pimeloyl-ACP methyl ester carboxylesterase
MAKNAMNVDLVQTTTRDGVRLDGAFQAAQRRSELPVDGLIFIHGTGGSFYSSTLFDAFLEPFLQLGCAVLRVNTRGHDLMSTAATTQGGRRQGAAYEIVDDCRHDLAAWLAWLRQRVGPRVGLIGHSLGAVKCLYALAQEPGLESACTIAISPPRLSHEWFLAGPERPAFREGYEWAERLLKEGRGEDLLEFSLPLPVVMTAGGYVEKYGPEERYNYLRFISRLTGPLLFTFGGLEVANNMAFRNAPGAIAQQGQTVITIAGADHFYTGARGELVARILDWLRLGREQPTPMEMPIPR